MYSLYATIKKLMDQFGKSQKIIIVEDNSSLAEIYKTRLEILGYSVMVAYDGITALNLIQTEKPDLVLLDLMVPKIAGDQILETMRKSDWGRDIPVYIISNLNESDAPAGLRGMGIEGYAVKANLSNDQLDQLVDSILTPPSQAQPESLDSPPDNTDNQEQHQDNPGPEQNQVHDQDQNQQY
jgi:DNA-binding response OmpR family regulator